MVKPAYASEHALQVATMHALSYIGDIRKYIFAIPNGGWRDVRTASRLKAEGVRAGVWDLFFAFPHHSYGGLWIELKNGRNSLTPEQKTFREQLAGKYAFAVCRTVQEVRDAIMHYTLNEIDKLGTK
jgi:hypothetical protein